MGRLVVGVLVGALLGAGWWGVREFIAAGVVCSKDDWDCLGLGLVSIPVSLAVGVLVGWLLFLLLRQERPLGFSAVGVTFAAVLSLLTVWVNVPAGAVVAGALGFALASPVTARHPVRRG
ncbi:hypothetical protein [Saccharothrix syringae]|uniref:hypothetical protein n=1 Tax=Saccharothrix syringae TaxID=103733 RepID=UPI00200CDD60|nr:hypothetical protein [Saccharothrix syringae]